MEITTFGGWVLLLGLIFYSIFLGALCLALVLINLRSEFDDKITYDYEVFSRKIRYLKHIISFQKELILKLDNEAEKTIRIDFHNKEKEPDWDKIRDLVKEENKKFDNPWYMEGGIK